MKQNETDWMNLWKQIDSAKKEPAHSEVCTWRYGSVFIALSTNYPFTWESGKVVISRKQRVSILASNALKNLVQGHTGSVPVIHLPYCVKNASLATLRRFLAPGRIRPRKKVRLN